MNSLDDLELRMVEASGDIEMACAAREYIEQALDSGALQPADLDDLTVTYSTMTIEPRDVLPHNDFEIARNPLAQADIGRAIGVLLGLALGYGYVAAVRCLRPVTSVFSRTVGRQRYSAT